MENLIKLKIIQGGMIPKIKNCIDAVENGVRGVVILDGRKPRSILKEIFSKERIKPIIITQVEYNGLSNKKLFLVNEFLKKFSIENNIDIIKLDEMIKMELNDYYDKVHTTPSGSKRIADVIYPKLKKILTKID